MHDLGRMERFYVEVLGYVVEWRPDERQVYLTSGEDNLALHQTRQTRQTSHTGPDDERDERSAAVGALDHIGLVADRAEDVHAWAAWLEVRGVALDTRPRTHRDGATSFYARDPEGNVLQFLHHPPISARD